MMNQDIVFKPIGYVRTEVQKVPRHWSVSDVEGEIILFKEYTEGLCDIARGDKIIVLFHFHKSAPFSFSHLKQKPPHKDRVMGVFSICSPIRPNPIGLSVLEVLDRKDNVIKVKGIDMYDGTPVIDIKPLVVP